MSFAEFRRRNLGDIRSSRVRRSVHERHGSAPISIPLQTAPRGPVQLSTSQYHSAFQRVPPRSGVQTAATPGESDPVTSRPSAAMDFSQFRDSGELSDITVCVDGREFRLHKFPLYTKSDFFRALARSESERVVLDRFPGGAETFEMVANFCYNKRLDIDADNACRLRCAAEFLQMSSPGNLADLADGYILDLLTTAKLSHDTTPVVDLLLACRRLGAIAEQAGIVGRCLVAIVDCWLMASKWTRRLAPEGAITDSAGFRRLTRLPLDWFSKLLVTARDKNVRPGVLANIVQMYIVDRIQKRIRNEDREREQIDRAKDKDEPKNVTSTVESEEKMAKETKNAENESKPKQRSNKIEDLLPGGDVNKTNDADSNVKDASTEEEELEEGEEPEDGEEETAEEESETSVPGSTESADEDAEDDVADDVDIGTVMDTLLLALPDDAPLAETFAPRWTAEMLRLADEHGANSCQLLLRLAATLLYRLAPSDWARIGPDLLRRVVEEAARSPAPVDPDTVCAVVDGYLLELAAKGRLDVDTFNKMAGSVPKEHRHNHDTLFKVLEKLLKSDKQQISDSEKEAMMELIDFRKLSESALQHAYDSKLVPDPYVTRAALALCARLRTELETARDIIRTQEEELDRFGLSGSRAAAWLRDMETDFGLRRAAPSTVSASYEPQDLRAYRPDRYLTSDLRDDPLESVKLSPPGHDPILEKALGGRYLDDPFDLDSAYPWHRYTRRTCCEDIGYDGLKHSAIYRHSFDLPSLRSTHYRSSRW